MSKVYTINTGNKAQFLSEYAFLSGSRITGSLFGTASWAQSSSVANSASFAPIGPGTVNSIALFNASTTVSSSNIFQSSNNIGIGTASPTQRLDVSGSIAIAGTAIVNTSRNLINLGSLSNDANTGFFNIIDSGKQIQLTDGTRDLRINSTFGGSNAAIGTVGSHDLNLFTANSFRVTIKSDGNVGIGTTNPTVRLQISGSANSYMIDAQSNGFDGSAVLMPGRFFIGTLSTGYPEIGYNFNAFNGVYTKIANDTAWKITFGVGNRMDFANAGTGTGTFSWTTRMSILSASGNVGIGTTVPITKLHVNDGSSRNFMVTSDAAQQGSSGIAIGSFNDNASAYAPLSIVGSVIFFNNNVGIGTINPATKLQVVGDANVSGSLGIFSVSDRSGTGTGGFYRSAGINRLWDSTFGDVITWNTSGNVGIGTTNPTTKLTVNGATTITGSSTIIGSLLVGQNSNSSTTARIDLTAGGNGFDSVIDFGYYDTFDANIWNVGRKGSTGAFFISNYGSGPEVNVVTINTSNNVGIGISSSINSKLQIQGNVSASSYTSSISNAVGFLGTSSWAVSASRASSSAVVDVLSGGSTTGLGIYSGSFSGSFFGTLTGTGGGSGAGFPYSGSAVITGSLLISGSGLQITGSTTTSGSILPAGDNVFDLGSSARRWANLYTGDLVLSNEGSSGNNVDGTTGNWTVQEGDAHLYIINNKSGKKYKFVLEEIE